MLVHVLGAGAGGGFPQWNCNCTNCRRFRANAIRASARTQSSIAVSPDGARWVLFNASPDIRTQIEAFPAIQPARAVRDTGIVAVVLIDSQIDHTTGMLMLRESNRPLSVYCTDMVHQDLTTGFPALKLLEHYCGVDWKRISLDERSFEIPGAEPLRFTAVALRSKAPPYSPHRGDPHPGDTIGVQIEDPATGKRLFYAPGLGEIEPHLPAYFERADCLLVDGTFWREDEMAHAGISDKRAAEMGHLPQSGPGGMIEVLQGYPGARRVLIHINNTNPILDEESAERAQLEAAGIEVAYDGMEVVL
jgi:pyrroloquinoline quinone biosynthesis protein B